MTPEKKIRNKARRRIRRFIETGAHQPRTYQAGDNRFEYKVSHSSKNSIFFVLKSNRLYLEKAKEDGSKGS